MISVLTRDVSSHIAQHTGQSVSIYTHAHACKWFTERMQAKAAAAEFKRVQKWLGRPVLIR